VLCVLTRKPGSKTITPTQINTMNVFTTKEGAKIYFNESPANSRI
jgi:hypothetical protein